MTASPAGVLRPQRTLEGELNGAIYFSADPCPESFSAETISEALCARFGWILEEGALDLVADPLTEIGTTVIVRGFRPMRVGESWIERHVDLQVDTFLESLADDYGDEDGDAHVPAKVRSQLRAAFELAIRGTIAKTRIYQCEECWRGEFGAEQVLALLKEHMGVFDPIAYAQECLAGWELHRVAAGVLFLDPMNSARSLTVLPNDRQDQLAPKIDQLLGSAEDP